jgi:hypothetical protein
MTNEEDNEIEEDKCLIVKMISKDDKIPPVVHTKTESRVDLAAELTNMMQVHNRAQEQAEIKFEILEKKYKDIQTLRLQREESRVKYEEASRRLSDAEERIGEFEKDYNQANTKYLIAMEVESVIRKLLGVHSGDGKGSGNRGTLETPVVSTTTSNPNFSSTSTSTSTSTSIVVASNSSSSCGYNTNTNSNFNPSPSPGSTPCPNSDHNYPAAVNLVGVTDTNNHTHTRSNLLTSGLDALSQAASTTSFPMKRPLYLSGGSLHSQPSAKLKAESKRRTKPKGIYTIVQGFRIQYMCKGKRVSRNAKSFDDALWIYEIFVLIVEFPGTISSCVQLGNYDYMVYSNEVHNPDEYYNKLGGAIKRFGLSGKFNAEEFATAVKVFNALEDTDGDSLDKKGLDLISMTMENRNEIQSLGDLIV